MYYVERVKSFAFAGPKLIISFEMKNQKREIISTNYPRMDETNSITFKQLNYLIGLQMNERNQIKVREYLYPKGKTHLGELTKAEGSELIDLLMNKIIA